MFNLRPNAPGSASPPATATAETAPPERPIVLVLDDNTVLLDGAEVARTTGIAESGRIQKVDGLYAALKERRIVYPSRDTSLLLFVSPGASAVVVKSVFQTAVFAGYSDVQFLVRPSDAGPP